MNDNIYNDKDPGQDESHQIISSLFLGPRAENYEFFKEAVISVLDAQKQARLEYFPEDGIFISEAVQSSPAFKGSSEKMMNALKQACSLLGKHSIPFWSPRYQGHMCMDLSMPALLGYFATMLYNPNNVSIEASPITTVAEIVTGQELCKMFGYNVDPEQDDNLPVGWGHIACDGSVANLESMWAARNLKFYPLSLRTATKEGGPLNFIADSFMVEKCTGEEVLLTELTTWELLNLRPTTILDFPARLYKQYRISPGFLDGVMKKYGIQTTGKSVIEKDYGIGDMKYFLSSTRHYSWPKSAAITGIGDANVIGIAVDHEARVDVNDLEAKLQKCLDEQIGVYAVVAIIGSTEEGAVDPLAEILELRTKFQKKGLSFLVHGDGAWGGYFCTMLPQHYTPDQVISLPSEKGARDGFVPDSGLRAKTSEDLFMLRYADSITIDPHKAAYIPYPAGGLCYRDGRMRYLLTFTSPYISRGETTATSIGVFGVEGSKPGASVMSTWFSNACIGLNPDGYGKLLGEVTFTCSRISAEWAAMSTKDDPFIVVPLNLLPSEKKPNSTPEMVEAERQRIRDQILCKTNSQIMDEDAERPDDEKALATLRELGSDLNINAFGTNWRYENGDLNDEVEEANYFNHLVIQDISVDSPEDDPTAIPFYLTSTTFMIHEYGECAQNLKKRMQLFVDGVDLVVMRNVVMSPWPTDGNFINTLIEEFRKVLNKHVITMRKRNDESPAKHTFLVLGLDKTYAVHFPMFHLQKHRHQLIMEIELSDESKKKYFEEQEADPAGVFVLNSEEEVVIGSLLSQNKPFKASLAKRTPAANPTPEHRFEDTVISSDISVSIKNVIKNKSLKGRHRDYNYPDGFIPFYLFGTKNSLNIDHMLVKSPNIQLSADNVQLDFEVPEEALNKGAILVLEGLSEIAMQPFQSTEGSMGDTLGRTASDFFFTPGQTWPVSVYEDENEFDTPGPNLLEGVVNKTAKLLGKGKMTLPEGRFVDSVQINEDPFEQKEGTEKYNAWKKIFDNIGKELA